MSEQREVNILPFLDASGKVKQIPVSHIKKVNVLAYLANKFEKNTIYNEKMVNTIIEAWHTFGDYFILRRLLIDYKMLERTADGAKYWVATRED